MASACLIIVQNLTYRGRPYALVENIIVDANARAHGHGQRLLREMMARAQRAGCYKLSLTSSKKRGDAHRFYEGLGFVATHEGYQLRFG